MVSTSKNAANIYGKPKLKMLIYENAAGCIKLLSDDNIYALASGMHKIIHTVLKNIFMLLVIGNRVGLYIFLTGFF